MLGNARAKVRKCLVDPHWQWIPSNPKKLRMNGLVLNFPNILGGQGIGRLSATPTLEVMGDNDDSRARTRTVNI